MCVGVHHLDESLQIVYRRMHPLRRLKIAAVEVMASEPAAVIAADHTVGVEHRNEQKDEVCSQPHCLLSRTCCERKLPLLTFAQADMHRRILTNADKRSRSFQDEQSKTCEKTH
jgi:hypothetical protein